MSSTTKSWIWFAVLLTLIAGAGIYVGTNRRAEPGKSFSYSVDDYRQVDPALLRYAEADGLRPAIKKLSALAVAPDGKIYVAGENAIEIFPDRAVRPVDGTPVCIAVDDDGTVFAGLRDHIEVVSKDGKSTAWPSPGEKACLTSVAVDDRYVYAADAGSRRVWRYGKAGGAPFEIGAKDEANGVRGFYIPSPFFDLAIGTDGSLWVVNPGYHALENYSPEGRLISSWQNSSFGIQGFSGCCNPANFALMPDGSFVTAEKGLPRVKIHNLDGSLRCVVAAPDQFDNGVTGLDVAADRQGRVYVLDPARGAVRIFEEKK
ncbi:MAG TPA: hypothetical protein PKI68_00400 [Pontiellaceae bacterium]|nr:hypothetical protein [Pontiellaceae bacterium]